MRSLARILPRRTVRLRLTLMYGGLFLASGAALLAITYLLVTRSNGNIVAFSSSGGGGEQSGMVIATGPGFGPTAKATIHLHLAGGRVGTVESGGAGGLPATGSAARATQQVTKVSSAAGGKAPGIVPAIGGPPVPIDQRQVQTQVRKLQELATAQHHAELHRLLIESGFALAIMAVVSMGLGWLIAGRALRPLHTITGATRAITASNLHERLALDGPDDELTELGDTIDGLLARLEASFRSQRQFVANASHELRTPLTFERALLEVALADPSADRESLRHTCERVLAASVEQERLIEALLTLACSERGLERVEPLDLGAIAARVVRERREEAERRGLRLEAKIASTPGTGDPRLVERLVANLVDNALRHNVARGEVRVETSVRSGRAVLSVVNSGPRVPAPEVERLFEPFQRRGAARAGQRDGHGLGLSIVRAIALAHGGTATANARPQGGLAVEVELP